jgi:integrase
MKTTQGYLKRRGGKWYACWTAYGKSHCVATHESDEAQARKKLADLVAPFTTRNEVATLEALAGRVAGRKAAAADIEDRRTAALRVKAAWTAYCDAPNRPDSGPRTLFFYEGQWKRFATWLTAQRGDCPLRDVTEQDATTYAAQLGKTVGASTFNRHIGLLRLVFRVLAKPGKVPANPFAEIAGKRFQVHSRRELTIDELRRVCAAAKGELRSLLALGVYTGLRLGDCVTLQWGEVDLARGVILRVPMKTARRNPKPVTVPLHGSLLGILANTPPKKRRGDVLPGLAANYRRDPTTITHRVQTHFKNQGVRLYAPGTGIVKKARKAKTRETQPRAILEVGFHSLRHSFVSLCRAAGAPLAVVESIVGHASPAMTRHYTHIGDAAAGAAVTALPDITGQAIPALPQPTADAATVSATRVRELADRLSPRTVKAIRTELLALVTAGKTQAVAPANH